MTLRNGTQNGTLILGNDIQGKRTGNEGVFAARKKLWIEGSQPSLEMPFRTPKP